MAGNIQLVKSGYDAFARRDIPGVLELFDPNIEWSTPASLPYGGVVRGREGCQGFFQGLSKYFDELQVVPEDFLETGDTVIVRGFHHFRMGDEWYDSPFAAFWTVRDGKVVACSQYSDTAITIKALWTHKMVTR